MSNLRPAYEQVRAAFGDRAFVERREHVELGAGREPVAVVRFYVGIRRDDWSCDILGDGATPERALEVATRTPTLRRGRR